MAGLVVDKLVCGSSRIKGSAIGSIEATQAVIDLCAAKNIVPELEIVRPEGIAGVFEELMKQNASGRRYVIDLASLKDGSAVAACAGVAPPNLGQPTPPLSIGKVVGAILSLLCCCGWRRRG